MEGHRASLALVVQAPNGSGPTTDAAVRGLQQAVHADVPSVTVDGIVGPSPGRRGERNGVRLIAGQGAVADAIDSADDQRTRQRV